MKWQHKCSLDWLRARQNFLTASDIKDLLPVTRTGRKRTVSDEDYLKVLSRKCSLITEDDCMSYGAMARGHIMEPYAIEMFNSICTNVGAPELYHWDDKIVTSTIAIDHYPLAFSPDAVDIPMDSNLLLHPVDTVTTLGGLTPRSIGEIKSYSPERHMICGNTAPEDLEERWQIATAMAVCSMIETAYLIFYNPSMREQMYVKVYHRSMLDKELEMIDETYAEWRKWLDDYYTAGPFGHASAKSLCFLGNDDNEQKIIERIMEKEKQSPFKTVSE
jgi:hypothetical protein